MAKNTGEDKDKSPNDTVRFIGRHCEMFLALRGWTQEFFGEKIGYSQQSITRFISNNEISREVVNKMAEALDVDVYYLTEANTEDIERKFQVISGNNATHTNIAWNSTVSCNVHPVEVVKEGFGLAVDILRDERNRLLEELKEVRDKYEALLSKN